ncbi:unnamed protein product, partial [Musa hybrid cultivar]
QPLQLRRVPWRKPPAAAAFSSVELISLRRFPRRTVDAAASSPSANGDSTRDIGRLVVSKPTNYNRKISGI